MARFDVYRSGDDIHLLDCQADALLGLNVRLVVPLLPIASAPIAAARLNPIFELAGERLAMITQYAASVHERSLGQPVATLAAYHDQIMAAFDMLLTGY